VRGVGLPAGLDIVAHKTIRAMFDPALQVPAIIKRNLKKHALILRQIGNRIALSPPVIITESEVDELVARLGRALDDTLAELRTG
jgi:4-aminobutyrate---pyruvate transaminase